jgi:hypothetical protein
MAKVRITFSSESINYAKYLNNQLRSLGHEVWLSQQNLSDEKSWRDQILVSLSTVDVLVPILSKALLGNNWAMEELSYAREFAADRNYPLIIPVVIENIQLPSTIDRYLCIIDHENKYQDTAIQINQIIRSHQFQEKKKKEERKEIQQKVESSAASFISNALKDLTEQEKSYKRTAGFWYGLAYLSLLASITFAFLKAYYNNNHPITSESLLQTTIIGIVLLGLIITLSKYAFTLGKSYMIESIRNADRRHAISFGEFYLKAYGDQCSREEIINVFKDWNIDKGSFFINQQSADLDPHFLKIISDVVKKYTSKK